MQTLSYFTKISINGNNLSYYETDSFSLNGTTYNGVIAFGAGTDFLVDQTPTYHRIKIGQNQYVTTVQNNPNLPDYVRKYVSPNAAVFFTTTNVESRYYFVTSLVTPTQSTVDLNLVVSNFYICNAGSPNFWSTFGNLIVLQPNNGYYMTMDAVTINNTYGGAGSGVPVDPAGNQMLTTPVNIADFTATPLGPVLGAADTGVLLPGFFRKNAFMVSVPGNQMRYMPYGNIITPDISQSSINARGLFGGGGFFTVTGPVGSFGSAITLTDYLNVFVVSAPVITTGFIGIYGLAIVPPLVQQINFEVGEIAGEGMLMNTDGSVFAFNSRIGTDSRVKIYLMTAPNVWAPIPVQLPVIAGDATLANSQARIGMTKDGRTIICCTSPAKGLYVYEDISVMGDWSVFHINDLSADIVGLSIRAVCISPEGSAAWAVIESAPGVFNEFAFFRRCAYNDWVKKYEGPTIGGYVGTNVSMIKTGYNALFTVFSDDSLIALDPPSCGLGGLARISDTVIVYTTVRGSAPPNNVVASPVLGMAANSNMTLITTVGGNGVVSNTGRVGSVLNNLYNQATPAVALTTCAFGDSNFGSIAFFGEPSTGTVFIITTSNNPAEIFLAAENFTFGSFNTGDRIMRLESSGGATNVNPGTATITDLGAPASRWRDLYMSGAIYLPGVSLDPAFATGTSVPSLIGLAAGLDVTYTSQSLTWTRAGQNVTVVGSINYSAVNTNPAGGTILQIELDDAIPGPALLNPVPGILTTSAGGLLPTTYNFYCTYFDQNHISLFAADAAGAEIPFTCGAGDPAPALGTFGIIRFVLNYSVTLN